MQVARNSISVINSPIFASSRALCLHGTFNSLLGHVLNLKVINMETKGSF